MNGAAHGRPREPSDPGKNYLFAFFFAGLGAGVAR
jgi:hypothetical protein